MIQSNLVNRFIWFNKNNQFKRMICSPFSRNSEIMIVSYQIHLYTFRTDYTAGVTWKWLMLLCCAFEALEEELTIEWHYMNSNEQDHLAKIHNLCSERKRRVVWTMCGWMNNDWVIIFTWSVPSSVPRFACSEMLICIWFILFSQNIKWCCCDKATTAQWYKFKSLCQMP